ncbi:MAG: metal ABC transporter ATP-binding protein [Oscillospiraceae bacterium]|jgi:zinc transport system ATP-binding protein|nr:metal ABC transporter ATP-binding protein [Oscillospiraceae bacterium]
MPLLSCAGLCLGYEGSTVVSGLSFEVGAGDYLCVVGENGSGKSTLMKTLLGLNAPLSGRIDMGDGLKAREIGYLPQQSAAQKDFPASVTEVVLSGCLNRRGLRPFYSRDEKRAARNNLERLGIASLAGRCYRELSGGQQQRVLLARALCSAGRILLLDEPAAGLDPAASYDMYALIKGLNEDGVSVVMISHDIAAAVKYASLILHIGIGASLFFGKTSDYLASGALKSFSRPEGGPR